MFTPLQHLLARMGAFLRPRAADRDFDDELETHLAMLAEDYARRGMSPEEARRAARIELGGHAQLREAHRGTRGLPAVEGLLQDIRYAVRALRQNPGFAAIAVLTLATGIGVNTAVFTAYNAMALRPLQATEPHRIMQVTRSNRDAAFTYPDYAWLREHNRSFSGLAAMSTAIFSMSGAGTTAAGGSGIMGAAGLGFFKLLSGVSEPVTATVVSDNYFQVLGVQATLGRTFLPEEASPAAQPVLLVSDNFWRRRLAGDPGLVGRSLRLNGIDVTVVGITPPDFTGTWSFVPDVWVTLPLEARLSSRPEVLRDRDFPYCRIYGRLRPGLAPAQAAEELNALSHARLVDNPPAQSRMESVPSRLDVGLANTGGNTQPKGAAAGPLFLLAAVGTVLLIACANVASLLLARSAARQREIAIRLAIGASRGRLIRQLLTENAVMSIAAGGLGIVFSWWSLHALMAQIAVSPLGPLGTVALHIAPDQRVLGYMLFLALGATLAFGLAPALEASRPNLTSGLKDEGAAFGGHLRKSHLRDLMVGAQVAVCLMLLITAGLLARSSQRTMEIDLGFDYRHIASLDVVFPPGAPPARIASTRAQLAQQLAALPEVESVAVTSHIPLMHGGLRATTVKMEGREIYTWYTLVSPSYFATMKIPILRGRNFLPQETRDGVSFEGISAIVSEATARRLWPDGEAIGKRFVFGRSGERIHPEQEGSGIVVGVARDVRSRAMDRVDETCIYFPVNMAFGDAGSPGYHSSGFVMRARGDEGRVAAAIERVLQAGYSDLQAAVGDSRSAFTNQLWFVAARLGAIAAAIIGILGLLMASVGIHGMVGFSVTQRTQEIGIRMALGAHRGNVLLLVLSETMRPVAIGLAVGFALAAMISRFLISRVFGLSVLDPAAFLGASAFLGVVAFVAGYIPARRATRVDPMIALRYE